MIGMLRGKIFERFESRLVIETSSGIGYEVAVPAGLSYDGLKPGADIVLNIYSHIREDAFDLYGFLTHLEKDLFLLLLSVNGVGPKLASTLISAGETAVLIRAFMNSDKDYLTQINGVGKKTAERLILELEDKIKKRPEWLAMAQMDARPKNTSQKAASASLSGSLSNSVFAEAKTALTGLGFRDAEADQLIRQVIEKAEFELDRPEELVRHALKLRGMG